jgi:hypothetical protein
MRTGLAGGVADHTSERLLRNCLFSCAYFSARNLSAFRTTPFIKAERFGAETSGMCQGNAWLSAEGRARVSAFLREIENARKPPDHFQGESPIDRTAYAQWPQVCSGTAQAVRSERIFPCKTGRLAPLRYFSTGLFS